MAETFSRFDGADYLNTDEHITAYLKDAAQDDDPWAIALALGTIARSGNIEKLARDTGMTTESIYKAFSPNANPEFATVVKIARAMGFDIAFRLRPTTE